ncbi:MAG: mechanosensitive ion channel family protein [Candidatus Limnocylindria bacterium]
MTLDIETLRPVLVEYLIRTLWALLVVILAIAVARAVRAAVVRALARGRAHPNVTTLLGNMSQAVVFMLASLAVLAIYTQDAFGWVLGAFSIFGLVIGLSLQDILKSFFAGIYILVERPFRIGDTVQVEGGHRGVVQEISFRATQLRTDDGREVVVPNSMLVTTSVVNLTRYPNRSALLTVSMSAEEMSAEIPQKLRDALSRSDAIAEEPPPAVLLRGVANGSARYEVTVWGRDRDRALSAAVAEVRGAFPQWEVQGA